MKEFFNNLWTEMTMKERYASFFTLGVICSALVWVASCTFFRDYEEDNWVEEIAEEAIETFTGWDLDISPFSPEN